MNEAHTPQSAGFLRLDGIAKTFGAHAAVHPVSLTIAEGEFITLLGPSGCGKTTLLRIIAGLEPPSAGRIHVAGRDVTRLSPERRPFNMVFQNYALFPHLSVFDNVAYGPRCAGVPEAEVMRRVAAGLDMVQLGAHAARPVDQLSGGMSQRIALIRAIVCEPQVLLLDEPLAALDLQLRKRMQVELRAIQERIGTTFIHVTHDQEEALALSDRIVLLRSGQIERATSMKSQPLVSPPSSWASPPSCHAWRRRSMVARSRLLCRAAEPFGCRIMVRLVSGLVKPG
jgi:ABC-type Fe3+/spermidine/putrescine transport system ATPase subunit